MSRLENLSLLESERERFCSVVNYTNRNTNHPTKEELEPTPGCQSKVKISIDPIYFKAKHTMTFPLPVSLGPSSLRFTGSSTSMTFKGHTIYFPEGCMMYPHTPPNTNKYPLKINGWKIKCPFEMVPFFSTLLIF